MPLLSLPTEVLFSVADNLSSGDTSRLSRSHSEFRVILASHLEIHIGRDKNRILKWAVEKGRIDIVTSAIAKGANVNLRGEGRQNEDIVLHFACRDGDNPIVTLLIEAGADVDCVGTDRLTPLHSAARQDHISTVELLLSHNANINPAVRTYYGSILDCAIINGYLELTKILLDRGAVSMHSRGPNTEMHLAAAGGHEPIVRLFLERGVDPDTLQELPYDVSCYHVAKLRNHTSILKLLEEYGANPYLTSSRRGWFGHA